MDGGIHTQANAAEERLVVEDPSLRLDVVVQHSDLVLRLNLQSTTITHEPKDIIRRLLNVIDVAENDQVPAKILPQACTLYLQSFRGSRGKPRRYCRNNDSGR